MSIRKWWRRKFVKPPIQPAPPKAAPVDPLLERYGAKSSDDLLVTVLSQAASHPASGAYKISSPTDTVQPEPFTVPMRDGKPATIYVYVNPETQESYEFDDVAQIDEIIQEEKDAALHKLNKRIHDLRKVQKQLR